MKIKKKIEYRGTGFKVLLLDFPAYEDEGEFFPDVPLGKLHQFIAKFLLESSYGFSGNEFAFIRAIADLNRSKAAKSLGITRRTLINWENNFDKNITTSNLNQIGFKTVFFNLIFPTKAGIPKKIATFIKRKRHTPLNIPFEDFEIFRSKEEQHHITTVDQVQGFVIRGSFPMSVHSTSFFPAGRNKLLWESETSVTSWSSIPYTEGVDTSSIRQRKTEKALN